MREETLEKRLAAANLADDELQYEHDGGSTLIVFVLLFLAEFGFGLFIGWVVFG